MPRYFFHMHDHGDDIDAAGVELANDAQARVEAIRYAGALLADEPELLWDGKDVRVQVTDELNRVRTTVVMLAVDGEPMP